jgi:cobalt/nickel transport system ATP-binding protein
MNPVIQVRSLRFAYPDGTRELDGIDVTIDAGESVALFGPNGSGKTTFVLHLNGLLAGEGDVRICGEPISRRNLRRIRQQVGLVFQDADDQLFMPTVGEDVAFGPLNLGATPEEAQRAAAAALEQVGLAGMERRAPYHLSAGEKRRAALAGSTGCGSTGKVDCSRTPSVAPTAASGSTRGCATRRSSKRGAGPSACARASAVPARWAWAAWSAA